jgi:thymidylate kinase
MIIVVEGVDAAGKSTLCQRLAAQYSGAYYATPPEQIRARRKQIDKFGSPDDSLAFYRNGVEIAAEEIRALERAHGYVFVDRHWISTAATHSIMGANVNIGEMSKLAIADKTILLTIDAVTQLKRFGSREMTAGDKRLLPIFPQVREKYEALVRGHCVQKLVIDTSALDFELEVEMATAFINAAV